MTCQVARNKSIFGAIVGTQVVLNELGRQVWEYWQGIPPEHEMSPELAAACRAGNALVLSPQPAGSRLNKKVATWCNEYILRHADEIWAGDISPNGMLQAMLGSLPQLKQ